jgi:sulfatase modifying factor 1
MNSKAIRPALALLLLFGLAPLLPAQSPPGPPPGPPGDTMKSLQEIWEEIVALKAQNAALQGQNAALQGQFSDLRTFLGVPPTIEMVPVGNAGNPADTSTYGAVGYPYSIGKYEVTNAQYAQFLNAVAVTDPKALYHPSMGGNVHGGITRSGASGSYTYVVKGFMGDKPVNYVSWYDALRFCNWLHSGRPTGEQDSATTEGGAYTLTGATSVAIPGDDPTHGANGRNAGARFWLPSEDEWHKAAYHDPANAGADANETADYWLYPTKSDGAPTIATADLDGNINNDTANIANYSRGADWNGQNGNVTTVGSGGPGSQSFYGAFDMGGNVGEWNEQIVGGTRGLRGGSRDDGSSILQSSFRYNFPPTLENSYIGFRVAGP